MTHASPLPPPGPNGPIVVCAVCGRVLQGHSRDGKFIGYAHAKHSPKLDDHVAVPVLSTEVQFNGRCDFCGDDGPRWRLPVEPFSYEVAGMTAEGLAVDLDEPAHRSADSWWSACEPCAAYLRAGRWEDLAWHAVYRMQQRREIPARLSARERRMMMDSLLGGLWELVRQHTTGPLEPLAPQQ